jgi:predicted lipid-binding transport protein (Tim44 family)
MGIFRERASTYLGLRASQQDTKPRIRAFVMVGVFWGAVMGVLMQSLSGHGFSGWIFVYWLMVGIVGFGPGTYWLASRKWRSNQ